MAEEPRKRRTYTRRPKAASNGGGIDWAQLEVALGPSRTRQLQQELRVKAEDQIAAGEAILRSLNGAATSRPRATTRTSPRKGRKITDPAILASRRQALAVARQVRADRRRQIAAEAGDQDLTPAFEAS